MHIPNLFIVGQPKSGTSALYEMLREHPEICMCDEKEPSFLAKDFLEESIAFHQGRNIFCHCNTMEEYLSLFNHENEKVIGEGSTHYLYSRVAANEIYKLNPDAKIIIMLREPINFMHALHAQQLSETREDEPNFSKALEMEASRQQGNNLPKRTRCPSYHFYKTRTNYLTQIQRYLKFFPKDQIQVIIFEDFKKNNSKYLKSIIEFLGISSAYLPPARIVNKNKRIRFRPLYYLIQSPGLKLFLRKRMPTRSYFQIKKWTDRLFFKTERREDLNPAYIKELKNELREQVVQLNAFLNDQQMININLVKQWGYN